MKKLSPKAITGLFLVSGLTVAGAYTVATNLNKEYAFYSYKVGSESLNYAQKLSSTISVNEAKINKAVEKDATVVEAKNLVAETAKDENKAIEQLSSAKKEVIEAENAKKEAEKDLKAAETAKAEAVQEVKEAKDAVETAEKEKKAAEDAIKKATTEKEKKAAEEKLKAAKEAAEAAEAKKKEAEAAQKKAEAERQAAEAAKQKAEAERKAAEERAKKAEEERIKAENARKAAEAAQKKAEEDARKKAEEEQKLAEEEAKLKRMLELAKQGEEQDKKAYEEALKAKQAEIDAKRAERLAQEEAERLAKEQEEAAAKEKAERLAKEQADLAANEAKEKAQAEQLKAEQAKKEAESTPTVETKPQVYKLSTEDRARIVSTSTTITSVPSYAISILGVTNYLNPDDPEISKYWGTDGSGIIWWAHFECDIQKCMGFKSNTGRGYVGSIDEGRRGSVKSITMAAPTAREGYKFAGWAPLPPKKYESYEDGKYYVITIPSWEALYDIDD